MIKIVLNGQLRALPPNTTIVGLLVELGFGNKRLAVEVNKEIVPRSQFSEITLKPGDRVEIVHAIGGG